MSSRLIALAAALLPAIILTSPASSRAELSRADRTAVLYSTQLAFDDNVPVITIAIMEDQELVRLSSPQGLRILPDGRGGASVDVPAGRAPWEARVEQGAPSTVRYKVVVAKIRAARVDEVRATQQRWLDRDFKVRLIELGSVFGFYGRVQDSRVVLVAIDHDYADVEKAREAAETLAASYEDADVSLHEEAVRRAAGTIVLSDGSVTVRNQDVVWVEPLGSSGIRVEDVEFAKGFPWHGREPRTYAGRIALTVDRRGRLAAINQVEAEKLLAGLVPAEIYASAPPEALAAQAVTARGELLAKIGLRHLADPYLICSEQHCQVYKGTGAEDERTTAAVAATKGKMLYRGDRLVDAVYSASCGGHSENNEDVWGDAPDAVLRGKPDAPPGAASGPVTEATVRRFIEEPPMAYCRTTTMGNKSFRWERRFTADEIAALVAKKQDVGRVLELKVAERGVSGRAKALEILGENGMLRVERELPIRQLLGSLKSALFVVDVEPGPDGKPAAFVVRGGGFGHGVGMCQSGAIGRAQTGATYDQILQHYYEGSEVLPIY
jgi:SpoIID/LytB domain protein